jgi:predicted phage replisome organizer
MAEVKWIKITTDIFDDEKISLIDGMPERDGIIVIWFKLLCMAGKLNNGGVFMLNDKIAYTDEMLATIFRRPLSTVRLALKTFEQFGMVDIINNAYTIPNWEKHQSLAQLEQAKEQTRKRVARHREKQKQLAQSNVTVTQDVTPCNGDRLEEEREEDIDKKKSVRETTHTLFERLLPDYIIPPSLADKLREWFKYKTERKEPYKEQGMKALLRQIENNQLTHGEQAVCDLIDDSMSNGWKGIIFDRLKKPTPNAQKAYQGGYQRNAPPSGVDRLLEMMERGDFDE